MFDTIRIQHPDAMQPVLQPTFFAQGTADRSVTRVAGIIISQQGKTWLGTTLSQPPDWVIGFDKVPDGRYGILVWDADNPIDFGFATFTVKERRHFAGLQISWPGDPGTAAGNFTAYGTDDISGATTVTGTMTPTTGAAVNAVQLSPAQGPPNWAIKFNCPSTAFTNPCTLSARDDKTGSDTAHVTWNCGT